MAESLKDLFLVYGRIITIFPLLLIATLIMGKRSIGELPVFDFLIILSLGSVVGADIADPKIGHLHTAVAIVGISVLQRLFSKWTINKRWFGRLITFEPTIVIRNGTFNVGSMKKIRYSLDNILLMLREKDVFDISEVEIAIVEANGNLTVLKTPNKLTPTIEDLEIKKKPGGFSYPVVVEGNVYSEVLSQLNLTETWLTGQLQKKGVKLEDLFYASVNEQHELYFSLKNNKKKSIPEVLH